MSAWSDTQARLEAGLRDKAMPKAEWLRALNDMRAAYRAGKVSRADVERLLRAQEDEWVPKRPIPGREAKVRKMLEQRGYPPNWTTAEREEAVAAGLRIADMSPVLIQRGLDVLRMLELPFEETFDWHLSEHAALERAVTGFRLQIENLELQRKTLAEATAARRLAEAAMARSASARQWRDATAEQRRACALRVAKGRMPDRERARRIAAAFEDGREAEGAVYSWLKRQERKGLDGDAAARRFWTKLTASTWRAATRSPSPAAQGPGAASARSTPASVASGPAKRSRAG